ncbi:hypothetical protein JL721_5803 [Aureococcus anophagefferens]|nr:hypothetical protein JL721_5803 [Aureococcus anophagefferens]
MDEAKGDAPCTILATKEEKECAELEDLAAELCASQDFNGAEPHLRRALVLRETALGPFHRDVAPALATLGGLLRAQGRFELAEPVYERALAIKEKTLGRGHASVAETLTDLAEVHRSRGDLDAAEPLLARANAVYGEALDCDAVEFGYSQQLRRLDSRASPRARSWRPSARSTSSSPSSGPETRRRRSPRAG